MTMMPSVDEIAWMQDCLCTSVDPDLWTSKRPCDQRLAALYCHTCKAESHCLVWALERRERDGTWGGQTAAQRRRMLREMDPSPVPPQSEAAKV